MHSVRLRGWAASPSGMEETVLAGIGVGEGAASVLGQCGVLVRFAFDRNTVRSGGVSASAFARVRDAVAAQERLMDAHAVSLAAKTEALALESAPSESDLHASMAALTLDQTLLSVRRSVAVVGTLVGVLQRAHAAFLEDEHGVAARAAVAIAVDDSRDELLRARAAGDAPAMLDERAAKPVLRAMEAAAVRAAAAHHASAAVRVGELARELDAAVPSASRVLEEAAVVAMRAGVAELARVSARHELLGGRAAARPTSAA